MTAFAQRLRERAQQLGLTHAQVAAKLGIDTRRFGNYVTGYREPDFATLAKLCEALQTTPDALLGFDRPDDQDARSGPLARLLWIGSELDPDRLALAVEMLDTLRRFPRLAPAPADDGHSE